MKEEEAMGYIPPSYEEFQDPRKLLARMRRTARLQPIVCLAGAVLFGVFSAIMLWRMISGG
jgi:hypothetical protein